MDARDHNTIYRDLICNGQRGRRYNNNWQGVRYNVGRGSQNTIARGWLDIPWVEGLISSRAIVGNIDIYVHHEK